MKNRIRKGTIIALSGLAIVAAGCLSTNLVPQIVSGGIMVLGGVFFLVGAAIVDRSKKEEEG